jgi:hypothetical protein
VKCIPKEYDKIMWTEVICLRIMASDKLL